MSILSGLELEKRVGRTIAIKPYDPDKIQPNSVDVTLGAGVCVYRDMVMLQDDPRVDRTSFEKSMAIHPWPKVLEDSGAYLDVKKDNPVVRYNMDESGWLIKPGILYLMHVNEVLYAPNLVMTLDGKSSLARLGIIIHFTAGHAETGFQGQYTMEVSGMHPVRIYPNMDIGQVIFTTVEGEVQDYKEKGNYVGQAAMGAQPSRSWRQFKNVQEP